MQLFPVVSKVNGRAVSGATVDRNADTLAAAINRLAGREVVAVGEPIVINPAYSAKRDPEQTALKAFLALALEGVEVVAPVAA